MHVRSRVRLEPVSQQWVEAFVAAAFRAIERWPFTPDGLAFGTDRPVLQVFLVAGDRLAAGSRYRGDLLLDVEPAPHGSASVRSWAPEATTSISAAATNLLSVADLVHADVELSGDHLTCAATYHPPSSHPLAALLRLRARLDLDLEAWWSGNGEAAPLRVTLTHAAAEVSLEVSRPVLVEGRWEVTATLEFDGQWWARPLFLLALEYAQHALHRRYGSTVGQVASFERVVEVVAEAWNDALPRWTAQSPGRLADQLLTSALFRDG